MRRKVSLSLILFLALFFIHASACLAGERTGYLQKEYLSEIDGTRQPYSLYVPESYSGEPLPLIVLLHGYTQPETAFFLGTELVKNLAERKRYIVAAPHGRGDNFYLGLGERDVLRVIDEVQREYHIDPDRVYLCGFSMGASGCMSIGLLYPDRFAAINAIAGPYDHRFALFPGQGLQLKNPRRIFHTGVGRPALLTENALNLPIRLSHGAADEMVPVDNARRLRETLLGLGYPLSYREYPGMGHFEAFRADFAWAVDWFERHRRQQYPRRVVYKTYSLRYRQAYWVWIDNFITLDDAAGIDASVQDQNIIQINTDNVAQFTLTLHESLLNLQDTVQISIDGQIVYDRIPSEAGGITFAFVDGKWKEGEQTAHGELPKTAGLEGPIGDAYNGRFIIVYGTADGSEEVNRVEATSLRQRLNHLYNGNFALKSDIEVSEADMVAGNIILVGTVNSNRILGRIATDLPFVIKDGSIVIGGQSYYGDDVGIALVYPNPLNTRRYVLVYTGVTDGAMRHLHKLSAFRSTDYMVFNNRSKQTATPFGVRDVLKAGYFDKYWKPADRQDQTAQPRRPHLHFSVE